MHQRARRMLSSFALLAFGTPSLAQANTAATRYLFFSGVDISTASAFAWAGVDAPLFSASRDLSGPVFRAAGGAGRYEYEKSDAPDGKVPGNVMGGEFLVGWRQIGRTLCVAVLGGFAIEEHTLDVDDPENEVSGSATGAKISAEVFWRPTARTQIEASAAYATTFDFYRARIAAGYSIWGLVAGPEAEAFGNIESEQIRLGVFLSEIDWRSWQFKAAAGALHDGDELGVYGRLGVDLKF